MNGAVMDYRQEESLRSQHKDSSNLHSSGYHLQMNNPCQQQNNHPQYSKAVNYQSDPYLVHGSSEHLHHRDLFGNDFRSRLSSSGGNLDSRYRTSSKQAREPMELPVPQFEIDENYVGVPPKANSVKDSKDLDLDTRINLLIKSKALSGMHPIFSDLSESEDSSLGSNDSLTDFPKSKKEPLNQLQMSPPEKLEICHTSFDDPETPLSRPPSPFLSRATYLFWFNKAIDLKQQAKAQEKALLEEATKKLSQCTGTSCTTKTNKAETVEPENNLLKILLDEVGKELTEVIKQGFINEIIENTAFNSLEDWWEKQNDSSEISVLNEQPVINSTTVDTEINKVKNNVSPIVDTTASERKSQDQKQLSPKVCFELESIGKTSDDELNNFRNPSPDRFKQNNETEKDELPCNMSSIKNQLSPETVKVKNNISLTTDHTVNERELYDQKPISPKVGFTLESSGIDETSDDELNNFRNPSPDRLKPNNVTKKDKLPCYTSSIKNQISPDCYEKSKSISTQNLNCKETSGDLSISDKDKFIALEEKKPETVCSSLLPTVNGPESVGCNLQTETSLPEQPSLTEAALPETSDGNKCPQAALPETNDGNKCPQADSKSESNIEGTEKVDKKLSPLEEIPSLPKLDVEDIVKNTSTNTQ